MTELKTPSKTQIDSVVEPQTLQIEGMTCNACVNSVERSLNAIPGVSATVNFAAETAHVLAPTDLNKKELIKAVEKAGYKAKLIANNSEITLHSKRSATAFIWSLIFTIPVVAISMVMTWQMKLGDFLIKFFNSMGWPLPTIYNAEFDTRIQANSHVVAHWAAIVLTLPVVLIVAYPIHRAAIRNFFHPTMDSLISLGSLVAFGWSIYANYMGEGAVYTEVAATVITFVILGRFLESRAKRSASSALQSLLKLGAKEVTVLRGGLPMLIPIDQLEVGDQFEVRPGSRIATDGIVISGVSSVDNSLITGESMPIEVGPGDRVIGATLNQNGLIMVRATRVGKETEFSRISAMVISAQGEKAPIQRLADRISAVFVPVVTLIAAGVFYYYWQIDGKTIAKSISLAVTVLVIACPCALGLATPVALLVASGRGAARGIVLRKPQVLEQAKKVTDVVLDKTGTLTNGMMTVSEVTIEKEATSLLGAQFSNLISRENVMSSAVSIEALNNHPIAEAIVRHGKSLPRFKVTDFSITPGAGASGRVLIPAAPGYEGYEGYEGNEGGEKSVVVIIGSPAAVAHSTTAFHPAINNAISRAESSGKSVSVLAWDGVAVAVFSVADEIKADAAISISNLEEAGIKVWLLTGDHPDIAKNVAESAGISPDRVIANASPEEKINKIKEIQKTGAHVLMVGDGVNDAAALAAADLSMAMGTGTDTAIATADITLMNPALASIKSGLDLSRKTLSTIRGNLVWAFIYNVIGIPIAALGLLQPMYAAAAMALSSLFVVTNSLRIK